MTSSFTLVVRLARWGRTLGKHGALRPVEADGNAPAGPRRLAWLMRLGSFAPKVPEYARAFEAIGPAAIKLGQALATRADLIGVDAARDPVAAAGLAAAARLRGHRGCAGRCLWRPVAAAVH